MFKFIFHYPRIILLSIVLLPILHRVLYNIIIHYKNPLYHFDTQMRSMKKLQSNAKKKNYFSWFWRSDLSSEYFLMNNIKINNIKIKKKYFCISYLYFLRFYIFYIYVILNMKENRFYILKKSGILEPIWNFIAIHQFIIEIYNALKLSRFFSNAWNSFWIKKSNNVK